MFSVHRFVERGGGIVSKPTPTADEVIVALVEATRRKEVPNRDQRIHFFLSDRNVVRTEALEEPGCDGLLKPLGKTFAEGFLLQVKRDCSEERSRFTLAHEACHTFFYEFVPEIKFAPIL